ncbi:MAG: hypothetical protein OXG15_13910 [Gammaproteobacteria bacterium]|nr:hypothetical protein [Gammaproteobacteria bacterium]
MRFCWKKLERTSDEIPNMTAIDVGLNPSNQRELEALCSTMYDEIRERSLERSFAAVVKNRITALYGPPMVEPDLLLVSFQGGGEDKTPTKYTWPDELLYLHDDYRFGTRLRKESKRAGLFEVLKRSTVAIAACFPEAHVSEAELWLGKSGPRRDWLEFSTTWLRRLIRAMQPKVVLVVGAKASRALHLENQWLDEEYGRGSVGRVFGRAHIENRPTIFCHHLSQGASTANVQKSLREVVRLLQRDD